MSDALFEEQPHEREIRTLTPGAVLVPDFLTVEQQAWIVGQFHSWAQGPVPIRSAKVRGHEMSVKTVCLGWHWRPNRYSREAVDVNGNRVLPFPEWMQRLGRSALVAAGTEPAAASRYEPDTALVNFYRADARMGMHQDRDELSRDPVVSLSIGDSCTFRFGNNETRNKPHQDVLLKSGDLFVFGGPARLAFHGVTRIHPDTAPPPCGLDEGRINITMRVTGMKD